MMAELWTISRQALDDYAYQSHLRAGAAMQSGAFKGQLAPVEIPMDDGGTRRVEFDQGVRMPPNREKMAALAPAFKPDGVVTAANSSQVSDGAAALLLASERYLRSSGAIPLARLVARVVVGSDPVLMLDGPIPATRLVLERAGLRLDQMDQIEINEAFASVVLAWQKETGANLDVVNPDGGAIAHGHPLGATGAILMTKLVDGLVRRGGRYEAADHVYRARDGDRYGGREVMSGSAERQGHQEVEMVEHEQPQSEPRPGPRVPDEVRRHLHQARAEARAGWQVMLPPEFLQHRRAARREALLAVRSLIDHVLKRLEEAEKS
jgi:acetyl-CoA acetyltransferase